MPRAFADRAQFLVVALWVVVVAAILDAYAHAHRISVVQDAINAQQSLEGVPVRVDADLIDRADLYVTLGLVGVAASLLVALAAWVRWQHDVATRLRTAVPEDADDWRRRPGLGVLAWIPPEVLVAPPLVVDRLLRDAGARHRPLVAGWWLAALAAAALWLAGLRDPDALADQRLPDGLSMGADALLVVAAVLAIGVVRRLTGAGEAVRRA